ncbi:uncharacterized protein LOC121371652 [Gigantopelta aegis]|uniref:uncharacterized protein LOC121371652 n=1 Tax=Gigantopelta aegis TaxID=1735272 RepID=UPI001B88C78A|nr:uncharacterized protein LOC121371652 [Gigantopelta aegis]
MATTVVFLLPLFIFPVLRCDDSSTSLKSVINAVEILISYYKSNYMEFNVDGLFGLRAVEGHVNLILNEYKQHQHQHLDSDTVLKLRKIVTDAASVGNKALEFVKRDDEQYYDRFKFVVHDPWDIFKRHREIDPHYKWNAKLYSANREGSLDESTSDMCMSELTGDKQTNRKPCLISDKCLQVMTLKGRTGYGITHQVLWTMLAEKAGCYGELSKLLLKKGYSSVAEMQLEFCTNNYYEMVAVVHIYMKGNITSDYQDLFLEQQFICPSIGFYEYLKKDYLTQIMSWQKNSGCFTDLKSLSLKRVLKAQKNQLENSRIKFKQNPRAAFVNRPANVIQPIRKQNVIQQIQNHKFNVVKNPPTNVKQGLLVNNHVEMKSFGDVKRVEGKPQRDYQSHNRQGRRLLVEKSMADGCLSHKTAVAAGALVMYLRYLIDPGALNLTSVHLILPESSRSLLAEAKLQDFQNQKVKGEGLIPVRQELGEELVLNQADDHEAVEDGEEEAGGNAEEQTEEEEDEDLDDADGNYKDEDEMYPDKPENPNLHDKKVVRFGNDIKAGVEFEKNKFEDDGDEDIQDHYVDGDKAKANHFQAGLRGGNPDQQDEKDEEEYTYYDPPDKDLNKDVDFEKKDVNPSVHKNVRRYKKKVNKDEAQQIVYGSDNVVIKSKPNDRTLFIVFASASLVIIFLMYRFIKKRRIHLRFLPRKLFKL